MFAYCNNNPCNHNDPSGHVIEGIGKQGRNAMNYKSGSIVYETPHWLIEDESPHWLIEDDGVVEKVKQTFSALLYSVEISGGTGIGVGQEFIFMEMGGNALMHYDILAFQYSDGVLRFGDRLELTVSIDAMQIIEFGASVDGFRENWGTADATVWFLINDKKDTWTLFERSDYTYFVGWNIAIGFDLNTFISNYSEIWG